MDDNVEGNVQLAARPTGGIVSSIDWRVAQLARGSTQRVSIFFCRFVFLTSGERFGQHPPNH